MGNEVDLSIGAEAWGHQEFAMNHHTLGIMRDDVDSFRHKVGIFREVIQERRFISTVQNEIGDVLPAISPRDIVFTALGVLGAVVVVFNLRKLQGQSQNIEI